MLMMYVQFGLYLMLMLGIGYYSMKKTQNNEDFIIGGRTLGPMTTAISAGASDMSGWLLLGLPGAVFASGLVEGVWTVSYTHLTLPTTKALCCCRWWAGGL